MNPISFIDICSDFATNLAKRKDFWIAFQAIATLLGVMVAIFLPFWQEFTKNNSMESILKAELRENYRTIKNATSTENIVLKGSPMDGTSIDPYSRNQALMPSISLIAWKEFSYHLASTRPKAFLQYNAMYDQVKVFVDPQSEDVSIRLVLQTMAAQKFVQLYESNRDFSKY